MRLELNHRSAYAIRAVLELARSDGDGVVPARVIAQEMRIPVRFLPQVMADLARAGIVEARLGRAGGYRLARSPDSVTLLDVIDAAESDPRRVTCVLTGKVCAEAEWPCDVHDAFAAAQSALLDRLAHTTIADILAGAEPNDPDDRLDVYAGTPGAGMSIRA
jgi:Rrf2 family protein